MGQAAAHEAVRRIGGLGLRRCCGCGDPGWNRTQQNYTAVLAGLAVSSRHCFHRRRPSSDPLLERLCGNDRPALLCKPRNQSLITRGGVLVEGVIFEACRRPIFT